MCVSAIAQGTYQSPLPVSLLLLIWLSAKIYWECMPYRHGRSDVQVSHKSDLSPEETSIGFLLSFIATWNANFRRFRIVGSPLPLLLENNPRVLVKSDVQKHNQLCQEAGCVHKLGRCTLSQVLWSLWKGMRQFWFHLSKVSINETPWVLHCLQWVLYSSHLEEGQ